MNIINSDSIDNLSIVLQEYLETINTLCQYHDDDHAHTKQIAEAMNVSMPSVVDALISLSKYKLINYRARYPVTLTPQGKEIAKTLAARQRQLYDFFCNVLSLDKAYSEEIACKLEHIVDEKLRNRISEFNSFLKKEKDAPNLINRFKKNYESL
ncbi:MAG TPA: hypothetical protein DD381_02420 [Lentisphaeria bacterium]|nr:MAG: hypothetical protein A2X47_08615 [Lentisphaerae bacterium GWF2_38_69]HBM15189.1 hypothetical protein [Lentisphaeria bacterium]